MTEVPERRTRYRYTECGLDNVFIEGIDVSVDDDGDEVLYIPAINELHRTIARGIVESETGIAGQELRFLRTTMGLTQAELARHVHHDAQSVARWEKNQTPIQPASEIVIRLLAVEKLNLGERGPIEKIAAKCVPGEVRPDIVIDGSGPPRYRLAA